MAGCDRQKKRLFEPREALLDCGDSFTAPGGGEGETLALSVSTGLPERRAAKELQQSKSLRRQGAFVCDRPLYFVTKIYLPRKNPFANFPHMDNRPWPHAPPHWTFLPGTYFVTASTFHRERYFDSPGKLRAVTMRLLESAEEFGWTLKAWAVLANHYHFLAASPADAADSLRNWLREFHRSAAIRVNDLSNTSGRRVWMNFRDSRITHQTSYLARLNYINTNPVKHGLVTRASDYPWCSASWFEASAPTSFVESVSRFKTDKLDVWDDFD